MKSLAVIWIFCFATGVAMVGIGLSRQKHLSELNTQFTITPSKADDFSASFLPKETGYYQLYVLIPIQNDARTVEDAMTHQVEISVDVMRGDETVCQTNWPGGDDNTDGATHTHFVAGLAGFSVIEGQHYQLKLKCEDPSDNISRRGLDLQVCYNPGHAKDLDINYWLLRVSGVAIAAFGLLIAGVQFVIGIAGR